MSLLTLTGIHSFYGHIHALKGISLTVERKIPVEVAVVPVFFQEFRSLNGTIEPFLTFFHLII